MGNPTLKNPNTIRPASRARNSEIRKASRELLAADLRVLDRTLPRKSHARLVISGNIVEEYRYAHPYLFNLAPGKARTDEDAPPRESPTDKRGDHVLRARRMIRRVIDANVTGLPIFITYTFKRNVKSLEEANPIFSAHVKELQRRYGKLKYLCVPEFQKRGAVHYHVIYFNLPFLKDIAYLEKIWGHGSTKVEAVRKPRAMGVYLSKYLQKSFGDSRLLGKKCYTASQGLFKPIEKRVDNLLDSDIDFANMRLKKDVSYQVGSFGSVNYKRFN